MTYNVTIEETISETFCIEAESLEEAYKKAIADYNNGTLVLSPGNCTCRQIEVSNPITGETTEWDEF